MIVVSDIKDTIPITIKDESNSQLLVVSHLLFLVVSDVRQFPNRYAAKQKEEDKKNIAIATHPLQMRASGCAKKNRAVIIENHIPDKSLHRLDPIAPFRQKTLTQI